MTARTIPTMALCLAAATTSATVAWACPTAPDIAAPMDALLTEIRRAPDERVARQVSNRMWELWAQAPDARAQELLDEGMQRRAAFDLDGAQVAFDALVDYCPDYAEGYNQRAFVNFIRGDYDAALPDLDRAIDLRPRHVAAIAGRGLTKIQLGRIAAGQDDIRAALDFNPWLSERQYLLLDPETGRIRPGATLEDPSVDL